MSKPLHFRKRQLLEYQHETSLHVVNEPITQFEYPSSPSSLDSGKSTPVEDVKNLLKPTDNTILFKSIEKSSNKSDVHFSTLKTDHYNTQPVQTLPNDDIAAFIEIENTSPNLEPVTMGPIEHDSAAIIDIENKLKQIIEASLNQQREDTSSMKPKPSTLLLAKLNQFKGKSVVQSKQINTPGKLAIEKVDLKGIQATSFLRPERSTAHSKAKRKGVEHIADNEFEFERIDTTLLKEKEQFKEIMVENLNETQNNAVEKPHKRTINSNPYAEYTDKEFNTSPNVAQQTVQFKPKSTLQNDYCHEEIEQIANRIAGVLATANRSQQRIADFIKKGINVHENEEITDYKSNQQTNDIPKRIKKQSSPPLIQDAIVYVDTPTTSKLRQPSTINFQTPKKTAGRRQTNFIHITADTATEEQIIKTPVSDEYNEEASTGHLEELMKSKVEKFENYPFTSPHDQNQIVIGPNGTLMSKTAWSKIDWSLAAPAVTRKILMAIFDRDTLATHSLTGRPSPAFKDLNKPEKKALDSGKVADTVYLVTKRINATPKEVRMAITTKCADECKMLKWRDQKKSKINNKENKRITPY